MRLYEFILRRLFLMIFVLFAISVITFILTRGILPPASAVSGYLHLGLSDTGKLDIAQGVGVATRSCPSWSAFIDNHAGCVVPLYQQYFYWLGDVLRGDWGWSNLPNDFGVYPTLAAFSDRFPYTVQLAVFSAILTLVIGFSLGIISATRANKLPDHLSRLTAIIGYSIPAFWFGLLLQLLVVYYLTFNGFSLFPVSGALGTQCAICIANPGTIHAYTTIPVLDSLLSGNLAYLWDTIVAMVLPAITLSITTVAFLSRILRSSMVEALSQDYITLARSKGLRERVVVYRHALRNAILPAITVSGLIFSSFLGGVIVVELIFNYPGIGSVARDATVALDVNFLELYVLVSAFIIVSANLIVDILYAFLDPRIRY
ncbi:MAG: ABC transporter permease [Thaumarchaeota archaeon]|nr:ABC transporter permease [Nitrososphaerota archaeon]